MADEIIYQAGPASLFASMAREEEPVLCSCLEIAGDDANCKVHGIAPPSIPPHQESVDGEGS